MMIEELFQEGHGPYYDVADPSGYKDLAKELLVDMTANHGTIQSEKAPKDRETPPSLASSDFYIYC